MGPALGPAWEILPMEGMACRKGKTQDTHTHNNYTVCICVYIYIYIQSVHTSSFVIPIPAAVTPDTANSQVSAADGGSTGGC